MITNTIAAISTPLGRGGISVIRISGDGAFDVAQRMFRPRSGKRLGDYRPSSAVYGDIIADIGKIDDGVAVIYRAPHSYTGEDTVEISCHGGVLLTERVLKTAFLCGAEPAGPGEFTQRAFMNGKLGLSEAEAVIGLINAESEEKLLLCASHASGVLSRRTEEIRASLVRLLSSVYVSLDYPEEDLREVSDSEFSAALDEIYNKLSESAETYREGRAVCEGVKTVLLGKPNVGKSSLMNALLKKNRAIVTDIPGTTRDTIEETVAAGRIMLRLCDTAGLRSESGDKAEKLGMDRAVQAADEAELIIAVFDQSRPLDKDDKRLAEALRGYAEGEEKKKNIIAVLNKTDLAPAFSEEDLLPLLPRGVKLCKTCTASGAGIAAESGASLGGGGVSSEKPEDPGLQELKNAAQSFFADGYTDYTSVAVIANARQFSAVCAARDAVGRARDAFACGLGSDVCGLDLEAAVSALGELDGRAVAEEITNEIFHSFCVGK